MSGREAFLIGALHCGTLITQRDWQSPVDAIPLDLDEIQWPNNVIVCGDGIPRYLPGPW